MNIFRKLLGQSNTSVQPNQNHEEHIQRIKENTGKLWKFIEETLEFYNIQSCQCAFPRFRQVVSIDCTDTSKSFYCSETEGFISHAKTYFTVSKTETGAEAYNELWRCNKRGSLSDYGWSDFSIHVNRAFLKIKELKTSNIGAAPQLPIPLFIGIFGHSFPGKDQLIPVDFDTFKAYITEMKS